MARTEVMAVQKSTTHERYVHVIKVLPEWPLEMVQFNVFVVHGTTIIKNTQI